MSTIFVRIQILLIAQCISINISGQIAYKPAKVDPYRSFIRLNSSNGLSNPIINDIVQDINGFVWIATDDGLNRFDGYKFLVFRNQKNDSLSLPGNIITSLHADSFGYLWIGTTTGLCCLQLNTGKIKRFLFSQNSNNCPRNNHIRKVAMDSKNVLWIETLDGTLSRYEIKTQKWQHFSHLPPSQPYYRYHGLYTDVEGNVWFGGRNLGLFRLDGNQELTYFKADPSNPKKKRDDDLADIYRTSQNKWYVVAIDGIYEFFPAKAEFIKIYASSAFSISEDKNGKLWFGSGGGLLQYNPVNKSFVAFKFDPDNEKSLADNQINKVYHDQQDNLWIGTNKGLCLLTSTSALFNHFYHIAGNNQTLSSNNVTAICEDTDGDLWVGTADEGINIVSIDEGVIKQIKKDNNTTKSIASNSVSALYRDRKGTIWVGLWAGVGFDCYEKKSNEFLHFAIDKNSRKRDWYNAFLEDSKENFWAGIWGACGLHLFNREKGSFETFHFYMPHTPYNQQVVDVESVDGSVLIATSLNILYEYKPDNKLFIPHCSRDYRSTITGPAAMHFQFDLPFAFKKTNDIVSFQNTAWILTDMGIFTFRPGCNPETFLPLTADLGTPLTACFSNDTIWVLFPDNIAAFKINKEEIIRHKLPVEFPSGDKYCKLLKAWGNNIVISASSEIFKFDNWESFNLVNISIPDDIVHSESLICIKDEIWVATNSGIFRYNWKEKLDWDKFPGQVFPENITISAITCSPGGSIAVFSNQGIFLQHPGKQMEKIILESEYETFISNMTSVAFYNEDCIIAGVNMNLFQISLKSKTARLISLPDSTMIASHLITKMLEWDDESFFLGSSDRGLTRLFPEKSIAVHYNSKSDKYKLEADTITALEKGLKNQLWIGTSRGIFVLNPETSGISPILIHTGSISSIVRYIDSSMWVTAAKGLFRIDPATFDFYRFTARDGIPFINFSGALGVLRNGKIAIGSNNGFAVFNPSDLRPNNFRSKVNITAFNVYGKLRQSFFYGNDTITLNYTENFFSFDFATMNFSSVASNSFYYRLNEVDPDWVFTTDPKAIYTKIAPGTYHFEVRNSLIDGKMDTSGANATIVLTPPFWQAIWFVITAVILLLGIITGILWIYISRLRFQQKSLSLEQKLLLSQMNPHFISNSLTAIQSYIYKNEPETAGNYLASFSKLIRQILEQSRTNYVTLENEILTIKNYIRLQDLRFPQRFECQIIKDDNLDEAEIMIPPMLAQPFIENAIEHGIMNSNAMGMLIIDYTWHPNYIQVTIEDNGIGVRKSESMRKVSEYNKKSLSTAITVDRLKAMGYQYGVSIIDLLEEGKNGTRVVLKLPYKLRKI